MEIFLKLITIGNSRVKRAMGTHLTKVHHN